MFILHVANALLVVVDWELAVPGLHVHVFSIGCSMQSNCHFLNSVICGMPEGKAYRAVSMLFPIIWVHIDRTKKF